MNVTYYAEGTYSETCKIHFPPGASGATIGKGFDFKHQTKGKIKSAFTKIGINQDLILDLQKLSLKSQAYAKRIIKENKSLRNLKLSKIQVDKLFEIVYPEYVNRAKSLTRHEGNLMKYGDPKWESMPKKLQELIVDMTYRGDYSSYDGGKRIPLIQKFIVERDYKGLIDFYDNPSNIGVVPVDRWNRRKKLVKELYNEEFLKINIGRVGSHSTL